MFAALSSIKTDLIIAALALACAGLAVWSYGHNQYRDGVADGQTAMREQAQKDLDAAVEKQKAEDASVRANVESAHVQDVQRAEAAASDAAAAKSSVRRLQQLLASARSSASASDPGPRRLVDDASEVGRRLEDCAVKYQSLADGAESDANEVIGLQSYIRSIKKNVDRSPAGGGGLRAGFMLPASQPPASLDLTTP